MSPGGTEAADRVADVLLLFARSDRPLGISRIARELGLSKAVVHRILQSLASRSLVQPVPAESTYALGSAAISLGMRVWSQLDIRGIAGPVLRRLRDQTGETATLSALVGSRRIYLDQYESPQEVKMIVEIGPQYALHSGASSRAILAFLPDAVIDEAIADLQHARPDVDEGAYRRTLKEIRASGYAMSTNERNTGAASIAAPFFDASGNVIGSISSSGPATRYPTPTGEADQEHVGLVISAAKSITTLLKAR